MRLSWNDADNIKKAIIQELYSSEAVKLADRKKAIARANHSLEMQPYKDTFKLLPPELLSHVNMYAVLIQFRDKPEDKEYLINEKWSCTFSEPTVSWGNIKVTPIYQSYAPTPGKLQPSLFSEAAQLCRDLHALRSERDELKAILSRVFADYAGIRQLQQALPTALHRFLPPLNTNPAKKSVARSNGRIVQPVEFPASLKIRLTNNLLER